MINRQKRNTIVVRNTSKYIRVGTVYVGLAILTFFGGGLTSVAEPEPPL